MTPDLAARRVAIASLMYYSLDQGGYMTDAEFDALATRLAGEWWGSLSPLRQWQLGREIATTGFMVKVTHAAAGAAARWLGYPIRRKGPWRTSKRHGVLWLPASEFTY